MSFPFPLAIGLLMIAATLKGGPPFVVAAQTIEPLFGASVDSIAVPAAADPQPYVLRSRVTALQVGVLDRALASPASAGFTLNLFDDATFAVAFERTESNILGYRTWSGHIVDRPLSAVSLTMKDGEVLGTITDGTTLYQINALDTGAHRIDEMDTSLMPQERDVIVPGRPSDAPPPSSVNAVPSAVSTADIFVYYSPGFRASRGGTAQAQARVSALVAATNQAYTRSGVDGLLNLLGASELPGVAEGIDAETLLDSFAADAGVRAQRDAAGADLVALLINNFALPSDGVICGIAYVGAVGDPDAAFSVTANHTNCVYTFTHETGHNLGAQHADADGTINLPGYPTYARAHKVPGVFRTVMAYICPGDSCPRILNFSNPAVPQSGYPTGIANQRENARRLNELFPLVASYRSGSAPSLSAPRNLQATVNAPNVTFMWLPPISGTPTEYIVGVGTQPNESNVGTTSVGLLTSVTLPLITNVPLYARVYARSGATGGPVSNEVNFTIPGEAAPSAPRNLQVFVDRSIVTLTWQAPATGTATNYVVAAGTSSNGVNVGVLPLGNTNGVSAQLPDGRYYVRMYAENALGRGPASNEAEFTIGAGALPGPPRNLTANLTGTTVRFDWLPPAGGGTPSGYLLDAGTGENLSNIVFGLPIAGTTFTVPNVPPGRFYVRVRAQNALGAGGASNQVDFGVHCPVPSMPQGFTLTKQGDVLAASWTPPAGTPPTAYVVQAGMSPETVGQLFNGSVGLETAVSARLVPGNYAVRVLAVNACGAGPATSVVTTSLP